MVQRLTPVHLARPGNAARPPLLFPLALVLLVAGFFLAPWSLEQKAHAALHGLCAQRPSHSFAFDGRHLPFDGRMTGIYGGFLVASLYLAARGRYRAFGLPRPLTMIALGALVASMAVDGVNSLLLDLRLWHPYEPRNAYRLLTGLGAGVALSAGVCYLLATTLWRSGRPTSTVNGPPEVGLLALLQAPLALAVMSGASWLFMPVTLLLLTGATLTVGGLMLVVVVLVSRREGTFVSPRQLEWSATVALLLAVAVMAGIAAARYLLEQVTGAPPLM